MRALIQKVTKAKVTVDDKVVGAIGNGLLLFLGIGKDDTEANIEPLIKKVLELRVFEKEGKHFDISIIDAKAEILVISQFTLYADCDSGRRPDFFGAAPPDKAKPLYEKFVSELRKSVAKVETGIFAAYMKVELENDGPITLLIEK